MDVADAVVVDWLTFTAPIGVFGDVLAVLEEYFGVGEPGGGGRWYREGLRFGEGVWLQWSLADDDDPATGRPECCVVISGRGLGRLESEDVAALLLLVGAQGWNVTRLDVAFDDYCWRIDPRRLWSEYAEPRKFSGFGVRVFNSGQSDQVRSDGACVSFGRRGKEGSGVFLRVYDKRAESGGAVDAVRWEVAFSKDRAAQAFEVLTDSSTPFASFHADRIGGLISGAVDFFMDAGEKNLCRRLRPVWWLELQFRMGCPLKTSRPAAVEREDPAKFLRDMLQSLGGRLWAVKAVCDGMTERTWASWVEDAVFKGGLGASPALKKFVAKVRAAEIDEIGNVGESVDLALLPF